MGKYVIKRVLLMILTLFVIMSMCFIFIKLLPMQTIPALGKDTALLEARREAMGYYDPLIVQFFRFWRNLFFPMKTVVGYDDAGVAIMDWTYIGFGLGEQMYSARDVMAIVMEKLPATIAVNLYSILIAIPIGLGLGIFAALKKNKWQDQVISTLVMLFVSVPSFVYAFLVQYVFCSKLGWLPIQINGTQVSGYFGFSAFFTKDPASGYTMFVSMLPAIISLAFGTVAGLARYTRAELTETLTSEYMLLARTKGLTRGQATIRHALKNSMVPIVPMIIGEFVGILGGSIIIEQIYGIPGVGKLYVESINKLDYNFFMALSAFYTLIGLAANIIVDISYGFIDPRIRMGSKK